MFAFGCWAGIKIFFARKRCMLKWYENSFFTTLWFCLKDRYRTLCFCLMDRYQNVCIWFMARNCRFPKVGTHCCQRGNHRLPLQGTAGSQRLERMVPNLGTRGYHCKQLPVPTWEPQVTIAKNFQFLKVGTDGSQLGNQRLPWQGTAGSQTLKTYGSQPENQRLLLQGIAGSQKLEFMFMKLSGFHCKELRVPKAWNSWFHAWKSNVTNGRICWLKKVRSHGS